MIGRWLGSRRDEFILATKCHFPTGPKPWDAGNSRKNIMRALDASLRRLGTDYVDLYQLHSWDADTPIDETLQALDDVVRTGKVRYVGCSNFLAYQLARSIGRGEVLGTANFVSVQPRYNLLFRENERELLPLCAEEGIAVIPYNPLAGGFLSGKHQPGAPTEGGRFTLGGAAGRYQERYWHDRMFETVDELRPIAAERRSLHGHAGRAVGAGQPGDHQSDHRRQPARAAGRLCRRGRCAARSRRSRPQLDETDLRIPVRRQRPLISCTASPVADVPIIELSLPRSRSPPLKSIRGNRSYGLLTTGHSK